jgi:hypothetical protein
MSLLTVPYLAGALLLAVAGGSKLVSPDSTVEAARTGGLPVGRGLVWLMAALEVIAGACALLLDGPVPSVAVGTFYLGFAGFIARGLVRGDLESCGCFADDQATPSWLHVVVDLGFAAAALAVAAGARSASLPTAYSAGHFATTTVLVLLASVLAYVVLARLPQPGVVPGRMVDQDPVLVR